jgi:hypothetical protein
LIHAHGNNYDKIIDGIPQVIELTYVHKSYFLTKPLLNVSALPCALDYPNHSESQDIDLNFAPFVNKN